MGLRLGFHYHVPGTQVGDQIRMPGYQGCFIDGLAKVCDEVICFLHSPVGVETSLLDYAIQSKNVRLVNLGPHVSVPRRTLFAWQYTYPVKKYLNQMDTMLLRGPTPLLPQMASAAKPLPISLLLVGDYVAGVNDLPQPRWRKLLIYIWSKWNEQKQLKIARNSLTIVNNKKLYRLFEHSVRDLYEIRTTSIQKDDFFYRSDTCDKKPYRLLYTGRMDRAKGLLDMIEAVSLLTQWGEDVFLDLVGWPAAGDPIMEDVDMMAAQFGVNDRIDYLGYKPLGPELFDCYKKADLYMIASKSSFEGFPRTIWEAMAHSLPVIATRIGSIPDYIEGSAWLVSPGSPSELAEAVKKLINSPEIRRDLITNGMKLAQENTLEGQSGKMIQAIEQWLKKRNVC